MKDTVTMRLLHKRMAVASWIFPLVSLLALAFAGDTSMFVNQFPAHARDRQMGSDIVALSSLLVGLSLATWCLTGGRQHLWPHYVIHAKIGICLACLVAGLVTMTIILKHLHGGP
jgi:hypothetical protein